MMDKYVIVSDSGIILESYKRANIVKIVLPKHKKEYPYTGEGLAEVNRFAIFNEDNTEVVGNGNEPVEYAEPDTQLTPEQQLELKLAQNTAETVELVAMLYEMQKIEQAQSNAELIELMMMLGGM